MWIRSQDRYALVNCNHIFMYQNIKLGKAVIASNDNADLILGLYSSKEKALKVLDTIHFYLNKGYTETTINTSEKYIMEQRYFNVFQMPQDDEV